MDVNARVARAKELLVWLHFLYFGGPDKHPSLATQRDTLRTHFDRWTIPQRLELGTILQACHVLHKAYQTAKNKKDKILNRIGGDVEANTDKELRALQDACGDCERTALALKTNLEAMRNKHNTLPRKNLFACDSIDKLLRQLHEEFTQAQNQRKAVEQRFADQEAAAQAAGRAPAKMVFFDELRAEMETGQLDYEETPVRLSAHGNWRFAKHIGHGGMATASLWVRLSDQGVVMDRIVRKDNPLTKEGWRNPRIWICLPSNDAIRIPYEYWAQSLAQGTMKEPAPNIVWTRKYENDEEKRVYRLYTSFCPYGDLHSLIMENKSLRTWLPESWAWMAFSALVDAGLAMESGVTLTKVGKQVVHRDLKPHNVFLDLKNPTSWPKYPQLRVGDFGLAILTTPDDPNNPQVYNSAGTRGWLAPEQEVLGQSSRPATTPKLLAHTNVWGVGKIMYDIVNLYPYMFAQYNADGNCTMDGFKIDAKDQYSNTLLETILACMAQSATKRPTFAQLRQRIDAVMTAPPPDLTSYNGKLLAYMSNARNGVQHHDSVFDLHGLPNEQYKVHMIFRNVG